MRNLAVHCDGSCFYKDKRMGIGIAFFEDDAMLPFREESITIPELGTSNEAEYHAVIHALKIILEVYDFLSIKKINIYTDSELIFSQIVGQYSCRKDNLQKLHDTVFVLLKEIKKPLIYFNWVPREDERQKIADKLSREANPYYDKRT